MSEWQPIETVPETRGYILVAREASRYLNRRIDIAHRDLSGTLWLSHEGYSLTPTHWMPLPDPPKQL